MPRRPLKKFNLKSWKNEWSPPYRDKMYTFQSTAHDLLNAEALETFLLRSRTRQGYFTLFCYDLTYCQCNQVRENSWKRSRTISADAKTIHLENPRGLLVRPPQRMKNSASIRKSTLKHTFNLDCFTRCFKICYLILLGTLKKTRSSFTVQLGHGAKKWQTT